MGFMNNAQERHKNRKKSRTSKFLFSEDNRIKQYWDLFVMLLVLYIAATVPYKLAFDTIDYDHAEEEKYTKIINYIVNIAFAIDLVLNFFTTTYNENTQEHANTHKKIAINYLTSWFIVDFVATFPIEPILNFS